MTGHVFVVQGDIRKLSCDAWLMPVDGGLPHASFFRHPPHLKWLECYMSEKGKVPTENVEKYWTKAHLHFKSLHDDDKPVKKQTSDPRIHEIILNHQGKERARLFSLNITAPDKRPDSRVEWQCNGLHNFFDIIERKMGKGNFKKALHGRERLLFAVPLVGTGCGGSYFSTGKAVRLILNILHTRVANTQRYDVVLCVYDKPTLMMAQRFRYEEKRAFFATVFHDPPCHIPVGYSDVFDVVEQLAIRLAEEKLVLFLGNGMNQGNGIPPWEHILDQLATSVGIDPFDSYWGRLDALSKAELVELRFATLGKTLGDELTRYASSSITSLSNMLVAGMRCNEVVTCNFDQNYEEAILGLRDLSSVSIIPNDIKRDANRWILKLHGCISSPDTIVATRQDYLRYMESNAALAGIVQAKLLTSQMLFLGFSLEDENFHKIIDSVLKAKRNVSSFGIALQPLHNKFTCEMWEPSIDCISMLSTSMNGNHDAVIKRAEREEQIFLDLLLMRSTSFSVDHILDDRFSTILTENELAIRSKLEELGKSLFSAGIDISLYPELHDTFSRYGVSFNQQALYFAGYFKQQHLPAPKMKPFLVSISTSISAVSKELKITHIFENPNPEHSTISSPVEAENSSGKTNTNISSSMEGNISTLPVISTPIIPAQCESKITSVPDIQTVSLVEERQIFHSRSNIGFFFHRISGWLQRNIERWFLPNRFFGSK